MSKTIKNKQKVESCDFVINGITKLRVSMNLSKDFMKELDKKLKNLQAEIIKEKMKELI